MRRDGKLEVSASLVADGQSAEAGQPCQRALDNPVVVAEVLATLDASTRDVMLRARHSRRQRR